jgi:putative nucleotidyltransferase with HDIG domain
MKQLKDKLIPEMRQYFGEDERRISHALRVTGFAEEILLEEQGDEDIVIAAAILHDIGIPEAERKYGSSAGHYQEIEGPPIAREILRKQELGEPFIEEVCEIIANHHSPGKINTDNFKIVYDADWLVNLKDEHGHKDEEKISRIINKVFLTPTGKRIARRQK